MKYPRLLSTIFLFITLNQTATATTVPLFVSVDATTFFTRPGETQQVNLINNLGNTYLPKKHWDNKTTVMFGAGAITYDKNNIIFNTAVRYFSASNMRLNGNVWQLNQPEFNNLSYSYRLKSDLILIEDAISWTCFLLQPNFILGLGYANNTASHYQTKPLSSHTASTSQLFTDKSTSQLAYEVGAGLDYLILKPAVIELAYRFIGAGKSYLGYTPAQTTTNRLSTGNIYYHTISLGIRIYYDHSY